MKIYKILLTLFLLSPVVLSQNFWIPTNGPTGGKSYLISFAPNNDIYSVGGYDHIYRSTNEGLSWLQTNFINSGAYRYKCYSFAAAQNGNLFAGGGDNIYPGHHDPRDGIFKSTDNGINWIKIIDAGYSKIVDFAVLSNGYMFAARDADVEHHSPGGIYRSSNNGNNWDIYIIPPFMIAEEGIKCLAADNSGNIYAGTTNSLYGYYYSSNNGITWSNRRDFYFSDITVNRSNGNVFAVKPNDGVFRSTNNGLNWVKVSGSYYTAANSIWENGSGTLFVQSNNTIYSSNNDGSTWSVLSTPNAVNILTLASKPDGSVYIGTDVDFIHKTTNNGGSWTQLSNGTINSDISTIAVNTQGVIFAVRNGGKIYKSNDNGGSWNLITSSIDSVKNLVIDTLNYMYACRNSKMYRSIDNGNSWSQLIVPFSPNGLYKFLHIGLDGNLYAATLNNIGIYRSTNHGNNWGNIGLNFPIGYMAVSRQSMVYAYVEGSGLFRTENAGLNWYLMPAQFNSVTSMCINSVGSLFITTSTQGVLRSLNQGSSWSQVNYGISVYPHQVITNKQNYLFAVGTAPNEQSYFYRSRDNGSHWESMNAGWSYNQYSSYLIAGPSGHLYTKAYKNFYNQSNIGIWRTLASTNTYSISGYVRYRDDNNPVTSGCVKALKYYNGQAITLDSAGIQGNGYYTLNDVPADSFYLMAVQADDEDLYFVPTYYPSTIYWQNASVIYPTGNMTNINLGVYRLLNEPPGQGKIGGGVYLSLLDNSGGLKGAVVYAKIGDDFKGYSISKISGQYNIPMLAPGNYEIICDMLGIGNQNRFITLGNVNIDTVDFYFHYGLIGVQNQNNEIPREFFLSQNYPNPFNPVTTISFGLPNKANVKLVIYDILGREIASPVNNIYNAGKYEISWNASNYSSGVYFYRLHTIDENNREFTDTKKLVVIK